MATTTVTQPKLDIDGLMRAFNRHDLEALMPHYAPDVEWVDAASPEPLRGRKQVKAFMSQWFKSFPDLKAKVKDRIRDGNRVAIIVQMSGTQKVDLKLPDGSVLPAANRQGRFEECIVITTDEKGRIERAREYYDTAAVAAQYGWAPQ